MKPGDLFRIRMDSNCPWRGKFAIIFDEEILEAGPSRYIRCFIGEFGIKITPINWLEGISNETR